MCAKMDEVHARGGDRVARMALGALIALSAVFVCCSDGAGAVRVVDLRALSGRDLSNLDNCLVVHGDAQSGEGLLIGVPLLGEVWDVRFSEGGEAEVREVYSGGEPSGVDGKRDHAFGAAMTRLESGFLLVGGGGAVYTGYSHGYGGAWLMERSDSGRLETRDSLTSRDLDSGDVELGAVGASVAGWGAAERQMIAIGAPRSVQHGVRSGALLIGERKGDRLAIEACLTPDRLGFEGKLLGEHMAAVHDSDGGLFALAVTVRDEILKVVKLLRSTDGEWSVVGELRAPDDDVIFASCVVSDRDHLRGRVLIGAAREQGSLLTWEGIGRYGVIYVYEVQGRELNHTHTLVQDNLLRGSRAPGGVRELGYSMGIGRSGVYASSRTMHGGGPIWRIENTAFSVGRAGNAASPRDGPDR